LLAQQTGELEQHRFTIDTAATKGVEDASTISSLRSELAAAREQISRNNALQALTKNQREPPSPTIGGLKTLEHTAQDRAPPSSRRRARRHSFTGANQSNHARGQSGDGGSPIKANPRAVSVMFPQNGPPRPRDSNGLPTISDGAADDIIRLLEDTEGLEDDVMKGLIQELKIPQASLHNPPLVKEIIFPAHLISLVSNEMWKVGMIVESESFLANVMQAIQNHVMVSYHGDRANCRHSKEKTPLFLGSSGFPTCKKFSRSFALPNRTPSKVSDQAKTTTTCSSGNNTSDSSTWSSTISTLSSTTFITHGCSRSRRSSAR
jgi:myosin-5